MKMLRWLAAALALLACAPAVQFVRVQAQVLQFSGNSVAQLPDSTPDAFPFPALTNQPLSTLVTSSAVVPGGYNQTIAWTASGGGSAQVNGAGSFLTSGNLNPGQSLTLRVTTSANNSTDTPVTVVAGGVTSIWHVTTLAPTPDTTPNAFNFVDLTGQALNTVITGSPVTPTGYDTPTSFTASGGTLQVAGAGSFVSSGTLSPGQSLTPRVTSSASNNTDTPVTVTVGGVVDVWHVTTLNNVTFANVLAPYTDATATAAMGNAYTAWDPAFIYGINRLFNGCRGCTAVESDVDYPAGGNNSVYPSDGYLPLGWAGQCCGVSGGNYYDRAKSYYVEYLRTGDAQWLTRGRNQVQHYIDNYLMCSGSWVNPGPGFPTVYTCQNGQFDSVNVPNETKPQPYQMHTEGLYVHWLDTGLSTTLNALGQICDRSADAYYQDPVGSGDGEELRSSLRTLQAFLFCKLSNAPTLRGANWDTLINNAITHLTTVAQAADGGYPQTAQKCTYTKPFYVGLLHDVWIELLTLHPSLTGAQRTAIMNSMKKSLDFLWNQTFVPEGVDQDDNTYAIHGFQYISQPCANTGETTLPADLLNLIISNGYIYYGYANNLPAYIHKGDAIFTAGLNTGGWTYSKNWNEMASQGYKAMNTTWRAGLPAPIPPNRLPTVMAGDLNGTPPSFTGSWTGQSVTQPSCDGTAANCSPDLINPYNSFTVSPGTSRHIDYYTNGWVKDTPGTIITVARRPTGSAATGYRVTSSSSVYAAGNLSFKCTFQFVNVWETCVGNGSIRVSGGFNGQSLDIGGITATNGVDGTIVTGPIHVAYAYVSNGTMSALPTTTPSAFAFSGGAFTVAGLGQGVASPIHCNGVYSVNAFSRGSIDFVVVNGDVVSAGSGVTCSVGRIRGLSAGVSATSP